MCSFTERIPCILCKHLDACRLFTHLRNCINAPPKLILKMYSAAFYFSCTHEPLRIIKGPIITATLQTQSLNNCQNEFYSDNILTTVVYLKYQRINIGILAYAIVTDYHCWWVQLIARLTSSSLFKVSFFIHTKLGRCFS